MIFGGSVINLSKGNEMTQKIIEKCATQKLSLQKIQEEIYDIFNYIVTFKSKSMVFEW